MRILGVVLQIVFLLALVFVSLLAGGIIANRLPFTDPPGPGKRLAIYLGTHVAETTPDSEFPELRLRRYQAPPALLFDVSRRAVQNLGWEITVLDADAEEIKAVVTTKIWRFKDDLTIRIQPAPNEGSLLYVHSVSRVGRGDLGANTRHVMDLHAAAKRILPPGVLSSSEPSDVKSTDPQGETGKDGF
jgi:hypothetical protein